MTTTITEAPVDVLPSEALANRFSIDRGTLALHLAHIDGKSPGTVAINLLQALGKRLDITGGRTVRLAEHRTYAPIWYQSHQVQTAALLDAQDTRPWLIKTTRELIPTVDNLVLVCEPGHLEATTHRLRNEGVPTERIEWDAFTNQHPVQAAARGTADRYTLDHLPDVDFLIFRDRCQRLNTAERFTAIDRDYRTAHAAASPLHPTMDKVLDHLAAATRSATSTAEMLVAIRATQHALFTRGVLLQVHRDRLLGTLASIKAPRPTDDDWRKLRAYIRPERGATVALYLLGTATAGLNTVTIEEIGTALSTGAISGQEIPPLAIPLLKAQLIRRQNETENHSDSYLALPGNRRHVEILTDARRDLDIPIDARSLTDDHKTHHSRPLYRLGLALRDLT